MNNLQHNYPDSVLSFTTQAKVMARYCQGNEQNECCAVSEKVTTKLVPVQIEIMTPSDRLHPCECFDLNLRIQNAAASAICSPKLQLTACPGVHICSTPTIGDIPAGKEVNITVTAKTDRSIGCSCSIKAILTFTYDGCCCKAVSNEWITNVSRSIPGLSIQKAVSPTCCITPGEVLCVSLLVQNTGNVSLNDVCITDELPDSTAYIANSTRICNMTAIDKNPGDGITVSCLKPKEQIMISYRLLVLEYREQGGGCL